MTTAGVWFAILKLLFLPCCVSVACRCWSCCQVLELFGCVKMKLAHGLGLWHDLGGWVSEMTAWTWGRRCLWLCRLGLPGIEASPAWAFACFDIQKLVCSSSLTIIQISQHSIINTSITIELVKGESGLLILEISEYQICDAWDEAARTGVIFLSSYSS